jgi:hypothetical protein
MSRASAPAHSASTLVESLLVVGKLSGIHPYPTATEFPNPSEKPVSGIRALTVGQTICPHDGTPCTL